MQQKIDESPDWIQCDSCDDCVHGLCVVTEEQWKAYEPVDVNFFCPTCTK